MFNFALLSSIAKMHVQLVDRSFETYKEVNANYFDSKWFDNKLLIKCVRISSEIVCTRMFNFALLSSIAKMHVQLVDRSFETYTEVNANYFDSKWFESCSERNE